MLGSKLDYIQIRHRNPESLTLITVRAKLLAGMLFLFWNIAWRVKSRSQTIHLAFFRDEILKKVPVVRDYQGTSTLHSHDHCVSYHEDIRSDRWITDLSRGYQVINFRFFLSEGVEVPCVKGEWIEYSLF